MRNLFVFLACLSTSVLAENKSAELPYIGTAPTALEPTSIKVTNKMDARSCNFDDVSAVTSKAEPGTQVNIPAGTCDWGLNSLMVGPGVYIKGAGKNLTTIVLNPSVDTTSAAKRTPGNFLITFNCAPGKPNALSNLALQGSGKGGEKLNGSDARDNGLHLNGWKYVNGVRLSSPCQDFRVFNSKFSGFGFSAITVNGNPATTRGVIFNNDFINNFAFDTRYQSVILGYGVTIYGDGGWPDLSLGTEENIFIENNYMSGNRHHVASNNSSRYVFRYNTATSTGNTKNHFSIDVHGRGVNNGSKTGSRQYEIYGNFINADLPASDTIRNSIGIRGGDGVIFNNIFGAQYRVGIELMVEGSYDGPGKPDCKTVPDSIRDLYIWENEMQMPEPAKNGVVSSCPEIVKLNRDYFLLAKKDYMPFAYPHPLRK
ncbi:MAG: hypothetical protein WCD07_11450 [Burkholderiales bacterium]